MVSFQSKHENMLVKSFHCGLKGNRKIIRKPRPIGNEFKNFSEARTNVVTHLQLYEGSDIMSKNELLKEYGATKARVLHLADEYYRNG